MGILKDILSITKDVYIADTDPEDLFTDADGRPVSKYRPVSYDSVAKQAKNGIMQFPVLATRSLSYDDIVMISKACERNFATMLQVVFSMNSVTNTDNPQEFVNQYHQNMNNNIKGASDVIGLVFNSYDPKTNMNPCVPGIQIALKEESIPYSNNFELASINEKFTPIDSKEMMRVMENRVEFTSVTEADDKKPYNPYQVAVGKDGMVPSNVFVDTEMKKCNELVPTLMHVRILKDMGQDSKFIDFIVGVKAMVHPINSQDMIDHLVSALHERGKLFRFLQWTTGEISFFKDLMLNIDSIKNDIKEIRGKESATWWRALKNIKASRRFHKWTRTGPVLPNATLVISQEEVDYIKANHGFDLLEDSIGLKIMEAYNLLQVVVVDSSAEVVHFLIDGENRYNTMTYKGLERQQGEADKQFKEILRAVNKLQ